MSIPDSIVEEVRSRADLVELIAEHTPLKRSGRTFRGPCPLHGGEGPNFSVDPARNLFKCFVCGEAGDVFSFPMKHLGMGFTEAVRWVAERVGVEIPEARSTSEPEYDPNSPLYEATAFASEWFRKQLLDPESGREAREYLAGRGITPEICERFDIGWAPERWSEFAEAARTHGIALDVLLELGLLKPSKSGRDPYDAFRGRVIFPIHSLSGRPVAFGGRIIVPAEDHVPKYLNSPESPIYHKGEMLYGLRWSRGQIRKEQTALVVEGYVDFVSLAAHGIENVVAPLGTAMTPTQAELVARYAKRVILLYDNDSAGLKATFRAADELLRAGAEVLVTTLPTGADPDSIVRGEGADALRKYLADSVDVLERKIQILERRNFFSSIAGQRRALDALLPTVRAASDELLRGLYISRIAERTGIPRSTIEEEVVAGASRESSRPEGRPRAQPEARAGRPGRQGARQREAPPPARLGPERNLILVLLRDDQWTEQVAARLGPEDFRDPTYRAIYIELLHLHAEGRPEELAHWFDALTPEIALRVQELLGDPEGTNLQHVGRFVEENLRDIEARNTRVRLAEIDRELLEASSERQAELLLERIELRRAMDRAGVVMRIDPARLSGEAD